MLLHSACVELAGTGVMLSALTDTGKTGTVLRLLREHGGRFLSDDMTVIDRSGNASWFPKPLTISAHTLRAVSADDLTRSEWRRLQIQSRLHSKGGRSIAHGAEPVQPAHHGHQRPHPDADPAAQVHRGPAGALPDDRRHPGQGTVHHRARLAAPRRPGQARRAQLSCWPTPTTPTASRPSGTSRRPSASAPRTTTSCGRPSASILAGFLANVRVRTLASDTFGWADEIPHLIMASDSGSAGASGNGASDGFSWAEESSRLIEAGDSRSSCASGNGASGNGASGTGHGASRTMAPPGPDGVTWGTA